MPPRSTSPAPNGRTQQQQQPQEQQPQDPASPSPPPPAPVPLTPGPRASRLQQVFSEALLRTLRANSYANFSACFPTPAKHVPHSLESVWRQLNAKLEESARAEFDDVLREREVVRGLNELDRLVGEARLRRDNGEGEASVPPHTLGANELYQAHLAPYLVEVQSSLNTKLETVQKENGQLSEKVESQRREIEQLLSGLEAVVSDVEGAAAATAEFDANHSLRQEAQEMDDEIKAVQRP
ncbi:kinetochore protein NNF1 [[Emmonsia] crescens]|uniref:Kinetochore protein NNF1 n=1 Tax=[Emmonsia] crescens TaxID=73230 RepID=A0A2B7ZGN7_9EURO|nr:kinetochore protein NNF1 [Emmonsia crescens]